MTAPKTPMQAQVIPGKGLGFISMLLSDFIESN